MEQAQRHPRLVTHQLVLDDDEVADREDPRLAVERLLRRPVILAAWAANAVCETIRESTGLQAKIKWPNDVLVRDRKGAGSNPIAPTKNFLIC